MEQTLILTWFDNLLIAIIGISAIIGLMRGFIKEAFSLSVWVLAFWISWIFFRDLALQFQPYIDSITVRLGLAFILLLILSLIVGRFVSFILIRLVDKSGMSGMDRVIGIFFGIFRGIIIVSIFVLLAGLTTIPQEDWWENSSMIIYFEDAALWLRGYLPNDIVDIFQYD